MELHRITSDGITKYVLVDDAMHLVHPVNRYLEYLRLQGRAECTIKSYGYDLKAFFVFLQRKGLTYGAANASMIQEYVEYLRSSREDMIEIYVKSARTGSTINRMIGTLYGFCCYLASVEGVENPVSQSFSVNPPVVFKDILYHTRKSNRTRRSVFKVKESSYQVHLLKADEIQRMYEVLPTERDKLILRFLLQSGARIRIESLRAVKMSKASEQDTEHQRRAQEKDLRRQIEALKEEKQMLITQLVEMDRVVQENQHLKKLLASKSGNNLSTL